MPQLIGSVAAPDGYSMPASPATSVTFENWFDEVFCERLNWKLIV